MIEKSCDSYTATIYIAGDLADAKRVCREFCSRGLCVTVEPTTYIYTGGSEDGVRVGLLNYPRFASDGSSILAIARDLADLLRERLHQHSWLIQTPTETFWSSGRNEQRDARG